MAYFFSVNKLFCLYFNCFEFINIFIFINEFKNFLLKISMFDFLYFVPFLMHNIKNLIEIFNKNLILVLKDIFYSNKINKYNIKKVINKTKKYYFNNTFIFYLLIILLFINN